MDRLYFYIVLLVILYIISNQKMENYNNQKNWIKENSRLLGIYY